MYDISTQVRQIGDVSVVDVKGKIVLGSGTQALRDTVHELLWRKYRKKIVFNLEGVEDADGCAAPLIRLLWVHTRNCGGRMVLLRPQPHVRNVLGIAAINPDDPLLPYEDEATAIRSF